MTTEITKLLHQAISLVQSAVATDDDPALQRRRRQVAALLHAAMDALEESERSASRIASY